MNKYIVLKFGGSSQCLEGINVILDKIREYTNSGYKIILVISAVGKTTNNLYGIVNFVPNSFETIYLIHKQYCESIGVNFSEIEHLLDQLKFDMLDYKYKPFGNSSQLKLKIISWGEILASKIVHMALTKNDITNEYLNAHQFIRNRSHSDLIDHDTLNLRGEFFCDTMTLNQLIAEYDVCVTQGFVATTSDNKLCVLTRSGSNTSAALIANAVGAERLEIFTDVSGLYSGDPRKISNTKIIPFVGYDVCLEASTAGTQLVHNQSLGPCKEKHIPIHIKNTFNPNSIGTIINGFESSTIDDVYLISIQNNITIFKISSLDMFEEYGFMHNIFSVFNDERIVVDIVTTSLCEVTTTTNEKSSIKINRTKQRLAEKYKVELIENCAIVSVIANDVLQNKKIAKVQKKVNSSDIKPMHISVPSSNRLTWSYVVDESKASELANLLHENLLVNNEADNKTKKRAICEVDIEENLLVNNETDNEADNKTKKISVCEINRESYPYT